VRYFWTRDELILALDLYFREPSARGSKTHAAVQELSEVLNRLPIHPSREREGFFRNANGVAMKLSDFLRFDPHYQGKGLERGSQLEEDVWDTFAGDRTRLHQTAQAIRRHVGDDVGPPEPDESDFEASEGRLLTRIHRARERNQALVRRKKQQVLAETGALQCEVCDFDFDEAYGKIGEGFAECHHLTPLAELQPGQSTRLQDLAILCANCHRMIHRDGGITIAALKGHLTAAGVRA